MKYRLIHVSTILVATMPCVYQRLRATNVNVPLACIQVHYAKSIRIRVNIHRVKTVFVNRWEIQVHSVACVIRATPDSSVTSKSTTVSRNPAGIKASVRAWPPVSAVCV